MMTGTVPPEVAKWEDISCLIPLVEQCGKLQIRKNQPMDSFNRKERETIACRIKALSFCRKTNID
jgi:hypothetical protein